MVVSPSCAVIPLLRIKANGMNRHLQQHTSNLPEQCADTSLKVTHLGNGSVNTSDDSPFGAKGGMEHLAT